MRLESALFTGASGIQSHGQAIAVVGDNISNSNTTGYKESRVEFADLMPKSFEGGSLIAGDQAGSGVKVAEVKQLFVSGILEGTGRDLDAAIDGEGFFMVGDAASPLLARAGNFSLDQDGNLVTSDGLPVLGVPSGGTALGTLNLYDLNLTAGATTQGFVSGNLDATLPITTVPANPVTFNEIAAAASFSQSFTVYDSLGAPRQVPVSFFKTAGGTWTAQAYIDGADVGQTAGVPVKVGQPLTLQFTETGVLANPAAAILTGTPAFNNGAAAGNFGFDFSKFTQYASTSSITNFNQNGQGLGNVKGYEIRKSGEIHALLDTGTSQLIGTIQLANYPNLDALERVGGNLYKPLSEAGEPNIGNPGVGTLGNIDGATLERSTVDLSTQFTNVILLQRGYQANSQMLAKTAEMLQQTIALIR